VTTIGLRVVKWFREWKLGRSRFGRKLSKSVWASQVPHLGLDRLQPEFEHFPVGGPAGRPHLSLGLGQGQFQPGLAGLFRGFVSRERRAQGLCTLRLFLLRLHRLAFESSRHSSDLSRNWSVPLADDSRARRERRLECNYLSARLLRRTGRVGNVTALHGTWTPCFAICVTPHACC
jgi:hypothetical protein